MGSGPTHPPSLYLNPQASRLAWIERVFAQAREAAHPLLERVKFLALAGAQLDEFFEIQVAQLLQRVEDGDLDPDLAGLSPRQELEQIQPASHALAEAQHRCWLEELQPALAAEGIRTLAWAQLDARSRRRMRQYFQDEVDPLLAPVVVDPAHPFPRPGNKGLCLAWLLRRRRRRHLGVVTLPPSVPRWIPVPAPAGEELFLSAAELVQAHAGTLFGAYEVLAQAAFRVTRNSNLYLNEEEARSVMEMVSAEVVNRRKGAVVRLEIESDAPAEMTEMLRANLGLDAWQVYALPAPLNLPRLLELWRRSARADLKFAPPAPRTLPREPGLEPGAGALFARLRAGDLLLHHPYDSYAPVTDFLQSAADDPRVRALRITLYRTSEHSPIARALMAAAAHKPIAAVVELKARFDEISNIRWSQQLEQAGVQVFHGLVGLKTHCKLALVVRRDEDGRLRRYVHLGTGNYNTETAQQYTDFSLLTADAELAAGAEAVFRHLTVSAAPPAGSPLPQAPGQLAGALRRLIEREAEHARAGRPARMLARMNGLLDKTLIDALYAAAQAGVEIDLLVRGVCALRPGMAGRSGRIRVTSLCGRFLEHSRALYCANGGDEEVYLSSADWMPRNLYGRVEVMFPVRDANLRRRVRDEGLLLYLADDRQAWRLQADGSYLPAGQLDAGERERIRYFQRLCLGAAPAEGVSAQEVLLRVAQGGERLRPIAAEAVWAPPEPSAAAAERQPRARRAPSRAGGRRA
jgi:polyphosphate kinase